MNLPKIKTDVEVSVNLENVKQHFEENKKAYISAAAGFAIGMALTLILRGPTNPNITIIKIS